MDARTTAGVELDDGRGGLPDEVHAEPRALPADISILVDLRHERRDDLRRDFGFGMRGKAQGRSRSAGNRFDPDPLDRGQPAEFVPDGECRRNRPGNRERHEPEVDDPSGQRFPRGLDGCRAECRNRNECKTNLRICPTLRILRPSPDPPEPPTPGPYPDAVGVFVQCVTNKGWTPNAVFGYQNDNEDLVRSRSAPAIASSRILKVAGRRGLPARATRSVQVTGIKSRAQLAWAVRMRATRTAIATSNFPEKCAAPKPPSQPIGTSVPRSAAATRNNAVFGYENDNPVDISVQIGVANFVLPDR